MHSVWAREAASLTRTSRCSTWAWRRLWSCWPSRLSPRQRALCALALRVWVVVRRCALSSSRALTLL